MVTQALNRGDLVGAGRGYAALLKSYPGNAVFWEQFGQLADRRGDQENAFQATQKALLINPQSVTTTVNLSSFAKPYLLTGTLLSLARWGQIVAPQLAHGYFNHASALDFIADQLASAIPDYRRAVLLNPQHIKSMINLQRQNLTTQPRATVPFIAFGTTLLAPKMPEAWEGFGVALKQADALHAAETAYRRAVILAPGRATGWFNFGSLMQALSSDEKAISFYRRSLSIQPEAAACHWNLALCQLLTEDFDNGWQSYHWRWKWADFSSSPPPTNFPSWQGENLRGRRLLVFSEQGLGDSIQFARYLTTLEAMGAKILFQCPQVLHRLFRHAGLDAELISADDVIARCDFQVALMSLPQLLPNAGAKPLSLTLPTAQKQPPVGGDATLNVGLIWAGNPNHHRDHERSISLSRLAPLLAVPRTAFFALQHGPAGTQVDALGWRQQIPDYGDTTDFFDAATNIQAMDVVISIDSALAHLAASLGKPTWIMVSDPPDWRWHRGSNGSRWYPTVRLFRQIERNNWDNVIEDLTDALTAQAIKLGAKDPHF
ncbi:MAG: hypothetical protein VW057_00025 [Rhodospirillaceae bacterium]